MDDLMSVVMNPLYGPILLLLETLILTVSLGIKGGLGKAINFAVESALFVIITAAIIMLVLIPIGISVLIIVAWIIVLVMGVLIHSNWMATAQNIGLKK